MSDNEEENESDYTIYAADGVHIWSGSRRRLGDRIPPRSPLWDLFRDGKSRKITLPETPVAVDGFLRGRCLSQYCPSIFSPSWTGWMAIRHRGDYYPHDRLWTMDQLIEIYHLIVRFEHVPMFLRWITTVDAYLYSVTIDDPELEQLLIETGDPESLPTSFKIRQTIETRFGSSERVVRLPNCRTEFQPPTLTETITSSFADRWRDLREIATEFSSLDTSDTPPTTVDGWKARALRFEPELLEQLLADSNSESVTEIRELIMSKTWRLWLRRCLLDHAEPTELIQLSELVRVFKPRHNYHLKIYYQLLFRWWKNDRELLRKTVDQLDRKTTPPRLLAFWTSGVDELDRLESIPSATTVTWYAIRTGLEQRVANEAGYEQALIDTSYRQSDTAPIRIACSGRRRRRVTHHQRTDNPRRRTRPYPTSRIGIAADGGFPAVLPYYNDLSRQNLASAWVRRNIV